MAKVSGVGKERIISGNKYFPIYYRFNGQMVINSSVKAVSKTDAYHQLEAKIKEFHSRPQITGDVAASLEIAREALRKDLSDLSNKKDSNYLWKNTFTRLFIDFPKKYYPSCSCCLNLPKGFFKKYKYYFCEEINRSGGWRAEIIRIKAMIKRLSGLGYCSEDDLKQIREITTPEGIPKPCPKVTEKQIKALLTYAKKDRPDYYKPIKFIAMTGRRAGETCSIVIKEDVTTDGVNPLSIQTKPGSAKVKSVLPKIIYLDDTELNTLIRSALANNKTKWLFPHKNGGRNTPNYLWKYMSEISDEVIGVRITAHGFRKLFLTKANIDGLNPISMQLANISSVSVMMKHYVGTSQEGQAKLLAKMRGDSV